MPTAKGRAADRAGGLHHGTAGFEHFDARVSKFIGNERRVWRLEQIAREGRQFDVQTRLPRFEQQMPPVDEHPRFGRFAFARQLTKQLDGRVLTAGDRTNAFGR